MSDDRIPRVLIAADELIDLTNAETVPKREVTIRRFTLEAPVRAPLRISAELRCDGVTGVPGGACCVLFNLEYVDGPVFWDSFLYPDTGSTPWRRLSVDVRPRGELRAVEMKIPFTAKGRLRLRDLCIETLEPWDDAADLTIAVFGDSTDMTCYCPYEHRLTRRLELLLRDRFPAHCVTVHGLAEGGEHIRRVVDSGRLARELDALSRCDIVLIRYGLNDHAASIEPAVFHQKLHAACDQVLARFPRATLVLSTTIPFIDDRFDQQTVAVSSERGLHLIDLNAFLRARSAAGDWDWHHEPLHRVGRRRAAPRPDDPDGLAGDKHPNHYGAQMLAELYFEQLEPIAARLLQG